MHRRVPCLFHDRPKSIPRSFFRIFRMEIFFFKNKRRFHLDLKLPRMVPSTCRLVDDVPFCYKFFFLLHHSRQVSATLNMCLFASTRYYITITDKGRNYLLVLNVNTNWKRIFDHFVSQSYLHLQCHLA